jgi:CHAT domain-containing protein
MVEAGVSASALGRGLASAVRRRVDSLGPEVKRVVIVPDGPLQRVPFDALRLRDGRFVIERYAVSVAPSAAVAAGLASRAGTGASRARVLALGDPRFAAEVSPRGGSATDVYRDAFSMNGGLPRLRASAAEAKLVARYGERSELRLRERASESYLKHAPLDSFDVIHLATHALVDERSWRARRLRSRMVTETMDSSGRELSARASRRASWCCRRVAWRRESRCAARACKG